MSGEAHKDAGEHEAKPSETTAPEETETTKPASQEEVENEVVEKGPDKATAPDKSTEQQYLEVLVSEGKEAQQTQPGAFPPSILLVLGLATVGSYLLFKFVKLRVAERVKRWVPLFHVVIWCLAIIIMGAIAIRRASVEWMLFGLSLLFTLVALNLKHQQYHPTPDTLPI